MARVYIVSPRYVKEMTLLSGNLDDNKFKTYILKAQDKHIQSALGTDLFDRILAGIEADDLNADEVKLKDDYIKPALAHWVNVEFLPYAHFEITNKGITRPTSENGSEPTTEDINLVLEAERGNAMYYTDSMKKYLCYNSDLYPEFLTNTDDDVRPEGINPYPDWIPV